MFFEGLHSEKIKINRIQIKIDSCPIFIIKTMIINLTILFSQCKYPVLFIMYI